MKISTRQKIINIIGSIIIQIIIYRVLDVFFKGNWHARNKL